MQRKYKKILSCFLAVFLFLSGICLKNIKADFLLDSTLGTKTSFYITSLGAKICDNEPCTNQMLGICQASHIQNLLYNGNGKTDLKLLFHDAYGDIAGQALSHFQETVYIVQFSQLYSKTVIMQFIHNQDGKKKHLS